jgi:hypothetical protein
VFALSLPFWLMLLAFLVGALRRSAGLLDRPAKPFSEVRFESRQP